MGVMTFARRSVPPPKCPDWMKSSASIASLPVHVDPFTKIEDAHGLIQVDFANKFLGGGVLGHGCVQEEIRFVICPELMVSMLFTEVLRPNEALIMIGCEQYSKYSGYGSSFVWAGDHVDETPLDSSSRRRCAVLAIDALPYATTTVQYRQQAFTRELNKFWVGLTFYTDQEVSDLQYPGVATGNWGCGAFNGSPVLKSLLQIMGCAESRRPMAYYTFGDLDLRDKIIKMYNMLSRYNVTVGQLYKYLLHFSRTNVVEESLYGFINKRLSEDQAKPTIGTPTEVPPENCDIKITKTGQKELNEASPELFSSDEIGIMHESIEKMDVDVSVEEVNSDIKLTCNEVKPGSGKDSAVTNMVDGHSHMKNDSKSILTSEKQSTKKHNSNTGHSSLLEEIAKLEENNSQNISNTRLSTFRLSNVSITDANGVPNEQNDSLHVAMPEEAKKKISKKITDYFNKKSI